MKFQIKHLWVVSLFLIFLVGCNLPVATTATPTMAATFPPLGTATVAAPTATTAATTAATATAAPVDTVAAPTDAPLPTATKAPQPTNANTAHVTILTIRMIDANTGWGVGEYLAKTQDIVRTSDGGTTWKVVSPKMGDHSNQKALAFFQDASNAWVIYTPTAPDSSKTFSVWHTTDAGMNWNSSKVDAGSQTTEFFVPGQIAFFDVDHGWILVHMGVGMSHDYVSIWTTGDGGGTWKDVVDPEKNNLWMSCTKSGVWFRDAQHGYASGSCNGVAKGLWFYQTNDSGTTWSATNLPAPAGSPDVFTSDNSMCGGDNLSFQSSDRGRMLVTCTDMTSMKANRWMYTTTDGGTSWSASALPGAWGNIVFLDANTGWYQAQPASDQTHGTKLFQTKDGGKTWKQIGTVNWSGMMNFVDEKTGWVVAVAGNSTALVRSKNGGTSWDLLNTVVNK